MTDNDISKANENGEEGHINEDEDDDDEDEKDEEDDNDEDDDDDEGDNDDEDENQPGVVVGPVEVGNQDQHQQRGDLG